LPQDAHDALRRRQRQPVARPCAWALRAVLRPHACPRQGRLRPTRGALEDHVQHRTHEDTVDAWPQGALDARRRRGGELLRNCNVRGRAAVCAAAARVFFCARGCVRFSALPRAVLLLCAMSFSVRGAACDTARCLVRCRCCARGLLLRMWLLVLQRVAACSAAAVCESSVCNWMSNKGPL
jgi:hypothetical protein